MQTHVSDTHISHCMSSVGKGELLAGRSYGGMAILLKNNIDDGLGLGGTMVEGCITAHSKNCSLAPYFHTQ